MILVKDTKGDDAFAIEGVGKKLSMKIDEILRTGQLNQLEEALSDDVNRALKTISQ